jgi:lipoprotein-anchoring transpeptidase ErfK/SrfK
MPRYKALSCLAFLTVLISAGSVGSQDPFRARSEAESAASALPISAPEYGSSFDPYKQLEPPVEHAPLAITPGDHPAEVAPEPAPAPEPMVQPLQPVSDAASAPRVQPSPVVETAPVSNPKLVKAIATKATPRLERAAVVTPEAPKLEGQPPLDNDQLFVAAQRRLFDTVPNEIEGYYDLFMYVSKANRGPFAQRMFVFQRDTDGKIIPYAEWRVSTGREKLEIHNEKQIRTTTPEGIFSLDPKRFYKSYWSKTWDGAPMHHAMFYDLKNNGNLSGLAIHAAVGASKIKRLGRRDSAGCVRLAPKNAAELFYKIKNTTKGRVPSFAINEKGSTDRWGRIEFDSAGLPVLQDGYRAVLFVENYDGRDEIAGSVVAYTN